MKRMVKGALVAAAIFAPAAAWAAAPKDATQVNTKDYRLHDFGKSYDVQAKGGVAGFLGGLSDFTGVGPVWGVTVGAPAGNWGFEASYEGSRTPITDSRVGDNQGVWREGLNAMAKLYAPTDRAIKPFAGVGLGASYLNVTDNADLLYQNDWVEELPIAVGAETHYRGIKAGLRATYDNFFGEEFAKKATTRGNPEGGLLSGALTVGGAF